MSATASNADTELAQMLRKYRTDPLGFVSIAYPWGTGLLTGVNGPDGPQTAFLRDVGELVRARNFQFGSPAPEPAEPIKMAMSKGHGTGGPLTKSQPINTPDGVKVWGDLAVGDLVFGSDGFPTRVMAVHEQGVRKVYRVTFDDGASTLCDLSHKWNVRGRIERRRNLEGWRTLSLEEIIEIGIQRPNGVSTACQWEIPIQGAAEFDPREIDLHPYFVGLWLGDGTRKLPQYTKPYPELVKRLRSLGFAVSEGKDGLRQRILGITHLLNDPVFQCYSNERYIPDDYKFQSAENRRELLRGLLDSDGECDGRYGSIGYSSTSRALIEDVVWLVRSLGGKASIQDRAKPCEYTHVATGERRPCSDLYRATIQLDWNPFTLEHRRKAWRACEGRYLKRWIESVEYSHDEECSCITVGAADGLFLANDFIVTHNSTMTAWLADWLMSTWPGSIGTVTAGTSTQLEERTWAAVRTWTDLCITSHWFDVQTAGMYAKPFICGDGITPESWKVLAFTCKPENYQSFAGQHARTSASWYQFDEACHDDQTDVLSKRGWIRFADMKPDDELLSMNPKTHIAEYVKPIALHSSHRQGTMITYEERGCNFSVTPNHKMYLRQKNGHSGEQMPWRFQEASELVGVRSEASLTREIKWDAPNVDSFTIPGFLALRKSHQDRIVDFDKWMAFLGWYYSEGSITKRINSFGDVEHIGVSITNQDTEAIEGIAVDLGFNPRPAPTATTRQITINDRGVAEHLASYGVGCLVKRIPDYVMQSSARQINIFLNAYVEGDGYKKCPGREIIYTSSLTLANQLQELCLKGGANSVIRKRKLEGKTADFGTHTGTSTCDGYVISRAWAGEYIQVKKQKIRETEYDGMVYCAELSKYHLLYTRRDGTCMWSGNSEVPDLIWETATGGLTDGQPMFFAWGQCVRNTGRFYQVCFGDQQRYWNTRTVDSRESRWPNKPEIERWREQYGEDSDYFRVRVLGLAPRASELQFIDWQRIRDAEQRRVLTLPDEPLVAGVDCSDGGGAWNVCRFRRGHDARSIPPIRIPGEHVRNDPHVLTARLAEALRDPRPERRIAAMFIDAAFGAHIAERLQSMGFLQVHTVRFGGASPDPDCANWRASMYKSAKDWLLLGAIPPESEDKHLCNDLAGPGYHLNQTRKLVIESKADMAKRKVKSPDDGDAHCFVENTLIRTSRGPIPIQDIRIGDEVATPFGSSKVALTHRHEVESLTHVRFSDGKSLSGTPNHEIFTFSGGRSRIDALSLTFDVDVDSQWRRFLWRLASLSFIGERSSGFKQVAHTFNPEGRAHRRDFFTAGCGLIISDLFQMVSRCITSMRTGATASQVIWPFGSAVPINVSTCSEGWPTRKLSPRTWSGWNWLGLRRQSGMGHLKDSIGIASTVSKLGLTVSRSQSTARDAERGISHSSPMRPIFAQAHALRQHLSGDTSQASGRAPSAAKSLWRTATGRRPAVHVYAETVNEAQNRKSQNPVLARFVEIRSRLMAIIGLTRVVPVDVRTESVLPTSVYNLTLERHNAYYANGVLVFNCLTFAQPVGPQVIATPNPRPPSRTNRFSYMG